MCILLFFRHSSQEPFSLMKQGWLKLMLFLTLVFKYKQHSGEALKPSYLKKEHAGHMTLTGAGGIA